MQIGWGVVYGAEDGEAGGRRDGVSCRNDVCFIFGYNVKFIRLR
jgi:hypothetical protein